jgi:HEAT repeat protein
VALVAVAAPRVTATQLPVAVAAVTSAAAVVPSAPAADHAPAPQAPPRVVQSPRPGGSLDARWRDALADAARRGLSDFWIVYTFNTPTHGDDVVISDTRDGSLVSSNGRLSLKGQGPSLIAQFNPSAAVPLEGANLAVLMHYRGGAIDRGGYRSMQFGFDFGRTSVFWLGEAPEAQSFARAQALFGETRDRKIQVLLIELASLHSNADVVIPFLTRLVDPPWPAEIRAEAAEGFEHHHDRRSVEVLLRVARTDADSTVRAEAAETIGDVQTPESIPALNDLVSQSADPDVRHEAAEALGAQPAARAIPALERIIATSGDTDVVTEAVEALGEFDDPAAMAALERIAREDDRDEVLAEAIETINDRMGESLHPLILELAVSGRTVKTRREALESVGEAVRDSGDTPLLDRAQRAIERAIFDDPDVTVRVEALDVLKDLPDDRAVRVLRDVIARHPDARVRREAEDHLRDRRQ